jgi:NADPH:quinone reductase-like Zn-dependent oxidoreductase
LKAVTYTRYGPPEVLQFGELEKPAPAENQVLVRVRASSVNAQEYRVRAAKPAVMRLMIGGVFRPRDPRLGADLAGTVEAVGSAVTQFRPGDEVFGCRHGAYAEYVCAREGLLAPKPQNVSFEQAAAVPIAGLTALQGLRDAGQIQPGQKVLIQGASGGVGNFALQIARSFGAEVTAVCSTRNLEVARSSGADHLIDYAREDFTRGPERYDLILAVNGHHSLAAYKRALAPRGRYICAGGRLPQIFEAILLGSLMSEKGGRTLRNMGIAKVNQEDLVYLGRLLRDGKLAPVIDRIYPLDQVVEAFRYVEDTHPQGKVVLTLS